jgi:hypothetical protein
LLVILILNNIVAAGWMCALLAWLHPLKPELLKVHLNTLYTLCAEFQYSS